jgi:hypothetical protein
MTTDARPAVPAPNGTPAAKVRTAKAKFGGLAVVCAKCAKRQGLRPKAIRSLLRDAYGDLRAERDGPAAKGARKSRKLCVVESGCLGPCPKRAIAVGTAESLARGRVVLLDPAAGREAARAALLPEFGPNAALADDPTPDGVGGGPPSRP